MKKSLLLFWIGIFCFVFPCFASNSRNCASFRHKGEFLQASQCYDVLAQKIVLRASSSEELRLQKGSYWVHAAKNLDYAANHLHSIERAAYLREKALHLLEKVQKQELTPLIRGKRRGYKVLKLVTELKAKIGYIHISVSTGHPNSQIILRGYRLHRVFRGQLNRSFLPGKYTIEVLFPGEKNARKRELSLSPRKSFLLTFVEKPKMPVISWVGYSVGGAALVGGGVVLVLGGLTYFQSNECKNDPSCSFKLNQICRKSEGCELTAEERKNNSNEEGYQAQQTKALTLTVTGGVLLSAGISLLTMAGISHSKAVQKDFQSKEKQSIPSLRPDLSKTLLLGTFVMD